MSRLRPRLALLGPLFLAGSLRAQDPALAWGVKAGVNLADASISPDLPAGFSKSSRTGFLGGLFAEARLSAPFSVALEGFYTQKGFAIDSNQGKATYRLDYVELPLTLKATFGTDVIRPYVFAGPNVGVRLSAKVETDSGTADFKDQTKDVDFAIDMGAGALYQLNPATSLLLDARYSLGLVNTISGGVAGDSSKSRGIKILAGVRFAFR